MASVMTNANTSWVSTYTFTTGELITKTILDTYLSGELDALKTPSSFYAYIDEGADYTIASTSFASVDTTDLHGAITTGGGIVLVGFTVSVLASTNMTANFDIAVDGTRYSLDDGLCKVGLTTGAVNVISGMIMVAGLSAAAHTFELQWKNSTGTLTMYAGAGTVSASDVHPTFFGIELA